MLQGLPFRRFDVIDQDFTVILRGPTPEMLEPVGHAPLEPEIELEVRRLMHERSAGHTPVLTGLVGLDHGIRVLSRPEAAGAVLVCTERLAIRGAFERLVLRHGLDIDETELARLLVAGLGEGAIAWRLGLAPVDAKSAIRSLLRKTGLRDRSAFVQAVHGHKPEQRRPARVAKHGQTAG